MVSVAKCADHIKLKNKAGKSFLRISTIIVSVGILINEIFRLKSLCVTNEAHYSTQHSALSSKGLRNCFSFCTIF